MEKAILNFIKPRISKTIPNNKRTTGGLTIPNFKGSYMAIVILKTKKNKDKNKRTNKSQDWHTNRQLNNENESKS